MVKITPNSIEISNEVISKLHKDKHEGKSITDSIMSVRIDPNSVNIKKETILALKEMLISIWNSATESELSDSAKYSENIITFKDIYKLDDDVLALTRARSHGWHPKYVPLKDIL